MGTPDFAVASLEALLAAGFNVVAVVTVADKPAGRGQQLQMSAVKQCALQHQIPVLQPVNLKSEDFLNELQSYNADLQFVVAFRMLPEKVWSMPRLGTYNLHGSLLPRYRGAAPINHAIINGDTESGVTTFKLQHDIDTGNILLQQAVQVTTDATAGELYNELMIVGAQLLVKTAQLIERSDSSGEALNFKTQDDRLATHAPKIFREHCQLNWCLPAKEVFNRIRGLSPYPCAFTKIVSPLLGAKTLKIYRSAIGAQEKSISECGAIVCESGRMWVAANNAWIELLEVQLEGKKRMAVSEFLKGIRDPHELRITE